MDRGRLEALLAEADRFAQRARQRGADDAEAFLWATRDVEVNVVGRVPSARVAEGVGLGVRVVAAGRLGHASCGSLEPRGVERAVDAALRDARDAPLAPRPWALPEREPGAGAPGPWDARIAGAEPGEAVREAVRIAGDMAGPDVRFRSALLLRQEFAFAVASTRGVQAAERGTSNRVLAECRVRRGAEERTGNDHRAARVLLDLAGAGAETLRRARSCLGAQPLPAARRDVLFDADTSGALLQVLAPALAGGEAQEGRSFLAGKLGQAVASEALTLRDAPSAGGPRAAAWDDEGTPSRDTLLVERGVLRSLLFDARAAVLAGERRTGSALRGGEERHRNPPGIAPMNLAPQPGRRAFEDLVAEAADAIVVRHHLMGLGHVNAVTGDFSLVAPCAWLVRRGEVRHALPPVTVAGTAQQALLGIAALASEAREGPLGTLPGVAVRGLATAT